MYTLSKVTLPPSDEDESDFFFSYASYDGDICTTNTIRPRMELYNEVSQILHLKPVTWILHQGWRSEWLKWMRMPPNYFEYLLIFQHQSWENPSKKLNTEWPHCVGFSSQSDRIRSTQPLRWQELLYSIFVPANSSLSSSPPSVLAGNSSEDGMTLKKHSKCSVGHLQKHCQSLWSESWRDMPAIKPRGRGYEGSQGGPGRKIMDDNIPWWLRDGDAA